MHLLNMMLKANGRQGVPQGGVISPLLSNLYLFGHRANGQIGAQVVA